MEVINLIIKIVLCILAVFLVVTVMLQAGKGGMGGAFGGGDVVSSKSKTRGRDAVISKATKFGAIAFMVLAVVLAVITRLAA